MQALIAEWGYNIVFGLEEYVWDADLELFLIILTGGLSEKVYFDQHKMLRHLLRILTRLDTQIHNGKVTGQVPLPHLVATVENFFPNKSQEKIFRLIRAIRDQCVSKVEIISVEKSSGNEDCESNSKESIGVLCSADADSIDRCLAPWLQPRWTAGKRSKQGSQSNYNGRRRTIARRSTRINLTSDSELSDSPRRFSRRISGIKPVQTNSNQITPPMTAGVSMMPPLSRAGQHHRISSAADIKRSVQRDEKKKKEAKDGNYDFTNPNEEKAQKVTFGNIDRNSLLPDGDDALPQVEYSLFWSETRSGDQGKFMETIRDQYLEEVQEMILKLERALADQDATRSGYLPLSMVYYTLRTLDKDMNPVEAFKWLQRGMGDVALKWTLDSSEEVDWSKQVKANNFVIPPCLSLFVLHCPQSVCQVS